MLKWKIIRLGPGQFCAVVSIPISVTNADRERAAALGFGWGDIRKAAKAASTLVPGSALALKAVRSGPAKALLKAAATAAQVADNPVLQAVLPPGTGAALKAAILVSKAVQEGRGGEALAKLKGPGAKRLAAALLKMKAAG